MTVRVGGAGYARLALVVGMQDNEYTDAQVGDAGGLFKSLDPAPCGAVAAYLIQYSSSSLPDPAFQFQSTSSSAAVPVYLIQCSSSSLTSFSDPIPSYLMQCSNSSLPHPVLCSLFLFFFFQISLFLNNTFFYNNIHHLFL